jgi:hypothetical protein
MGKFVLTPQWDAVESFQGDTANVAVSDEIGMKWGVIDKKGAYVVKPQHRRKPFFSEGLAVVCESTSRWRKDASGGEHSIMKCGFIDNHGNMAIDPQWEAALPFRQGLAAVVLGDIVTGKWGFIDKSGRYVIDPQFDDVSYFSEGLAAVRIGDSETGKWGFIAR